MKAIELAIEIIKKEGIESSWNKKFYQPAERVTIYVNGEEMDITERVASMRDSRGYFQSSPVIDEYARMRTEIYKAKIDAMMRKEDKNQAMQNYINNL